MWGLDWVGPYVIIRTLEGSEQGVTALDLGIKEIPLAALLRGGC